MGINDLFLVSLIVIMLLDPFLEDFTFGGMVSLGLLSISATLCMMVLEVVKKRQGKKSS